jgi:hypothetical protein
VTDPGLFEVDLVEEDDPGLTVPLAQRYGLPPFSVINRHSGHWQQRKRKWNALGLDSKQGRSQALLGGYLALHAMNPEQYKTLTATSIFDPALCELAYDWFSAPGDSGAGPVRWGQRAGAGGLAAGAGLHRHRSAAGSDRRQRGAAGDR